MPYDDEKCLPWLEDNYLQIMECLPLQEVPVYKNESFTSPHQDVQRVDDSVSNLKRLQLQEVPGLGSQSSPTRLQDGPLTKECCNRLYVKEMSEIIISKLANLDISGQFKELAVRDHNVSEALVKIDPPKKRKVLPKVELDEETLRVWRLLMENDGSEPMEETDKDKEEWWERQRKVFHGRMDSFIAKMHLIKDVQRVDDSVSNLKWLQLQQVPVLGSRSSPPRLQVGPLTKEYGDNLFVKEMSEIIIRKLANLDISGQFKELVVRDHNVSVALVNIDPPRKRKVLPKVELDEETLLLMDNDGSEPLKETNKDNEE